MNSDIAVKFIGIATIFFECTFSGPSPWPGSFPTSNRLFTHRSFSRALTLLNFDVQDAPKLTTIIFGAIVIFEIIGPIFIRFGLVKAGEVPFLTILAQKTPVGLFEGLHQVVDYFRSSIGLPEGHQVENAKDILVKYMM